MKSEVIKYIKSNKYIEELFLDFINDFKEQYNVLNKSEKQEMLKIKDEIFRNWLYSSIVNETNITPNYLINNIIQDKFPGKYTLLPMLGYVIKNSKLDLEITFQFFSIKEHPIFKDIDIIIKEAVPLIILQYEKEGILKVEEKIIDNVSIQSPYYVNYLIQLCEKLNILKEMRAINCKCFQRDEKYILFKKLSKKEKLNKIILESINIAVEKINKLENVEKKISNNQLISFLNNNVKEEEFNTFISEIIPFANQFIENIDQFTDDKKILDTIKFAQVLMGENIGSFVMGTEIRICLNIYFTTIFSYYLGILEPTYLGAFLINEIISGLKESESEFEKNANIFNDELSHDLTKLGVELVKAYNSKLRVSDNKFNLQSIENIIESYKLEKREVLNRYNKCRELYGDEDDLIHKFMNIINDDEERTYSFIEEHINKFSQYLIEKKGLKEKTVSIYSRNVQLFIGDFLDYENEEDLANIDNKIIDNYLGEWFVIRAATSINSIKEQIRAMSHYCNFLYFEGLISNKERDKIKETIKNKDKYIIKYMKYLG